MIGLGDRLSWCDVFEMDEAEELARMRWFVHRQRARQAEERHDLASLLGEGITAALASWPEHRVREH